MLLLDRIMMVTNSDYLKIIDENSFTITMLSNEVVYYKFKQEYPFYLLIKNDLDRNELMIEFTGKILLDRYREGINIDNIEYCLNQINQLGFCELDVNLIIQDSIVLKCDVIKEVRFDDINIIIRCIRQSLKNYKKWIVREYPHGIVLENNVKTQNRKKRLVVYDKERELMKASNHNFVKCLGDISCYAGIVRFELNIKTMKQIRDLLSIESNMLNVVLSSKANPIFDVIDEALIAGVDEVMPASLRDYERMLLLNECNNDLVKVEARVRGFLSKGASIRRYMKPYVELSRLQNDKNVDIRELVA